MYTNTIRFSPVVTDGIPDFARYSFEWEQWWGEQRRRCMEGYTVDGLKICGTHYFYLNFWKILGTVKGQKKKTLVSPKFTALDFDFFWEVEKARKLGKHLVVAKRRQCGFSEKGACIAAMEFMFYPHSQTLIVAGEYEYAEDAMRKTHRGMNAMKNTEFYKRMNPTGIEFAMARFKDPQDKDYRGYMSELHTITCNNNSQATVGKTPSLVIFEEAGKFPNLVESFNYIRPALETEGETTAFALIFGTGGEMGKGADQLMTMFYSPSAYNCMEYEDLHSEQYNPDDPDRKKVGYFVPAWRYLKIDEEGNDLKEESLEYLIGKRERAKKTNNAKTFFDEITQFPIYTEECFLISDGNVFNSAKLNRRLAEVRRSKEISERKQRGFLDWVKEGRTIVGVTWRPDENGPFLIFEHPERDGNGNIPEMLYKGGTDSYDRDEAVGEGSKGSTSIIKGFWKASSTARRFVARITLRPELADDFYEMSFKLNMYYNCLNLIEYSNLGIFKWAKNMGLEGWLKERPEVAYANVKDSKMQNKYGVDPQTKSEWITRLRDYIESNVDDLDDEEQIVQFLKYRHKTANGKPYNCDITISSALAVIHLEDDFDIEVRETGEQKTARFRTGFKMQNGKFTRVYS
jgi:hypothetical protein